MLRVTQRVWFCIAIDMLAMSDDEVYADARIQ